MGISMEMFNLQTKHEIFSESLAGSISVFHNSADPGLSFFCFSCGLSSQLRWSIPQNNPVPYMKKSSHPGCVVIF